MQIQKTIRLIWTFYKGFLLASVLINACCLIIFWKYGFPVFTGILWLKIITLGYTYYLINGYKKREYYYYQNLGISKILLWTSTLTFDLSLFIFLITQIAQLK